AVGRIAQQRLADALAEDPSLTAGGAEQLPAALGARRVAADRHQPAGAAVQRQLAAVAKADGDPAETRHILLDRLEHHLDVAHRADRAAVPVTRELSLRPAQPRGQPTAEEQRRGA